MTPKQLFEMAQLDALALLDEDERADFAAALAEAPAALREQVLREQARFADLRQFLPDVAPPPELRGKVVDAVLRAAAEDRPVRHEPRPGRHVRPVRRGARVSPAWRGAAIGFAAASLTLGLSTLYLWSEHERIDSEVSNSALVQSIVENFGVEYVQRALFDIETRRVVFRPAGESAVGRASIFTNPAWKESRLFCLELPGPSDGRSYRVVALDDNDRITATIAEFRSTGALMSSGLPLDLHGARRLAIIQSDQLNAQPEFLLVADAPDAEDATSRS